MSKLVSDQLEPLTDDDGYDTVGTDAEVLRVTDKAILIDCEGEEIWFPKSQLKSDGTFIYAPDWLCEEKGL